MRESDRSGRPRLGRGPRRRRAPPPTLPGSCSCSARWRCWRRRASPTGAGRRLSRRRRHPRHLPAPVRLRVVSDDDASAWASAAARPTRRARISTPQSSRRQDAQPGPTVGGLPVHRARGDEHGVGVLRIGDLVHGHLPLLGRVSTSSRGWRTGTGRPGRRADRQLLLVHDGGVVSRPTGPASSRPTTPRCTQWDGDSIEKLDGVYAPELGSLDCVSATRVLGDRRATATRPGDGTARRGRRADADATGRPERVPDLLRRRDRLLDESGGASPSARSRGRTSTAAAGPLERVGLDLSVGARRARPGAVSLGVVRRRAECVAVGATPARRLPVLRRAVHLVWNGTTWSCGDGTLRAPVRCTRAVSCPMGADLKCMAVGGTLNDPDSELVAARYTWDHSTLTAVIGWKTGRHGDAGPPDGCADQRRCDSGVRGRARRVRRQLRRAGRGRRGGVRDRRRRDGRRPRRRLGRRGPHPAVAARHDRRLLLGRQGRGRRCWRCSSSTAG